MLMKWGWSGRGERLWLSARWIDKEINLLAQYWANLTTLQNNTEMEGWRGQVWNTKSLVLWFSIGTVYWRPEVFELLAVILTWLALQIPLKVCNPAHVAEAPCLCITTLQHKCVLWRILLLLFQLEEVCPFVRRANRGFTMSSTSRRSTVTGTPSASGMSRQLNIPVINYAYLLKSRISTAGGLLGFTS